MLLQRASCLSLKYFQILCLASVLAHLSIVTAFVFCSRDVFGIPDYRDCMDALSSVPTENVIHFFVEQQLRTGLPEAGWAPFTDPRPTGSQKEIMQVPKLWSHGRSS